MEALAEQVWGQGEGRLEEQNDGRRDPQEDYMVAWNN